MPLELDPRIDTRELSNPQSSGWLPVVGVLFLLAYLFSAFSATGLGPDSQTFRRMLGKDVSPPPVKSRS